MKAPHILALVLVAVATSAQAAKPKEAPQPTYNFDYIVAGADAVGIKRVFDDGKNTVLILEGAGQLPTVTTAEGTPLPIKRVDNYAVLPGLQRDVLVYSRGTVAHVVEGKPAAPVRLAAQASSTAAGHAVVGALAASAGQAQNVASCRAAGSSDTPVARHALAGSATPCAAGRQAKPTDVSVARSHAQPSHAQPAAKPSAGVTTAGAVTPSSTVTAQPTYWSASTDDELQTILPSWARRVQWRVIWVPKDINYRLPAPLHFSGSFTDSVKRLMDLYKDAKRPLRPDFYPLQRLVVITEAK